MSKSLLFRAGIIILHTTFVPDQLNYDRKNDINSENSDLLTEISVAYYQDGATQEEISKKFSISRAKVGRMLKQARDEGIVEITVKYHPVFSAKIEQRLVERFGVKRALIALDQPTEELQRLQVAGLVSNYLNNTLKNGTVITVGQGRNVSLLRIISV